METTLYLLIAAILGIFASLIATLQEFEKRRRKKKEPTLQDTILDLTENLKSSVAVITEIEEEISRRKNLAKQLEEDIEKKKGIMELSQAQLEAAVLALEIPIKKESRTSTIRNGIINLLIALAIFALGYFLGGR